MKKNVLIGLVVLLVAIFLGQALLKKNIGSIVGKNYSTNATDSIGSDIGREAIKQKAIDFVKNNLVQPGTDAPVKEMAKEGDLYRIVFTVGKQDITTYMTQDGAIFFPQVMNIAEVEKKAADDKQKAEEADKNITKSEKPAVDLYVMAFCPFGNKAEDTLKPAYDLLKNKVDFNFHYIVSTSGNEVQSLHGTKEVTEDEREACVLQNYGKDKWMDVVTYVNDKCGSDGSCWDAAVKNAGVDAAKIDSCVSSQGTTLMKAEEEASKNAGASGSPTMIINGTETKTVYQYGNSEAYKKVICSAFNTAPEECSQQLSSSTSTTQGGSCGN